MRYNQDDQTFQTVSEGSSAGTVVGILVAVFVVLGVFAYWWFKVRGKKKKDTDVKTPPAATPAAPPPPPSSEPLPAGWSEGTDPQTGVKYYYNAATGQTQWTVPV